MCLLTYMCAGVLKCPDYSNTAHLFVHLLCVYIGHRPVIHISTHAYRLGDNDIYHLVATSKNELTGFYYCIVIGLHKFDRQRVNSFVMSQKGCVSQLLKLSHFKTTIWLFIALVSYLDGEKQI